MAEMGSHEDIITALHALKPNAVWTLAGSDYSGLDWLDGGQSKPTEQEILDEIAA